MASIFVTSPGQAVALDESGSDAGIPLSIDSVQGSWFQPFKSILTDLSIRLSGNRQFQSTLKTVIYVYAFGDKISQMRIGGVCFAQGCPAGTPSGLENILNLYAANKISSRPTPIQIQIGMTPAGLFTGFLGEIVADVVKPENRISQFGLIFDVFPSVTGV